jgi:hypothetical protein
MASSPALYNHQMARFKTLKTGVAYSLWLASSTDVNSQLQLWLKMTLWWYANMYIVL